MLILNASSEERCIISAVKMIIDMLSVKDLRVIVIEFGADYMEPEFDKCVMRADGGEEWIQYE